MKSGAATKQAPVITAQTPRESQTTQTRPVEKETDPAADFLIGALLYSLFAGGALSEMLPDGDDD